MKRAALGVAFAVATIVFATPGRAAECAESTGTRVMLASDAVDPDVFLWDSRARLVNYTAGQWGDTRAIFAHTILAEPGTRAMVVSCVPAVARPQFGNGDEDAVGVKVISGRHRGRYGWVLSSDVHAKGATADRALLAGRRSGTKR